jgi:hypothetical protein
MAPARTQPEIIDGKAVKSLAEAHALHGATILGQPGGWAVVVRYGALERTVAAQRSRQVRLWRNLNTAASYVRDELGMSRFEVDAVGHEPDAIERRRPDASARLKRALSYDEWARKDLELAVRQADDPATAWVDQDEAMAELTALVDQARAAKRPTRG